MKDSIRHGGVRGAVVRALFAVVMLVVASLQPGMVAMAKSAMHPAQTETLQQIEDHDHEAAHGEHAVEQPSSANDARHHGGTTTADLCCDMHCMPATGVPPCWSDLAHPPAGAFGRVASGALTPGETHGLIRPPRI
jgi:hypothetical protein